MAFLYAFNKVVKQKFYKIKKKKKLIMNNGKKVSVLYLINREHCVSIWLPILFRFPFQSWKGCEFKFFVNGWSNYIFQDCLPNYSLIVCMLTFFF